MLRITSTALAVPPLIGKALIRLSQVEEFLKAKASWDSMSATVASETEAAERRSR